MKRFLVIYSAPLSAQEQMAQASPEDIQAGMAAWAAWAERCGSALVDMGGPFIGRRVITDKRAVDARSEASGFSIIQARDMDEAIALMDNHPHMGWAEDCEIAVHETMPMPD